jgi:branched-chain amino acid transport system substrate-binding protein
MKAFTAAFVALVLLATAPLSLAQKKYDPGASDTEIKIGQSMPYSGPASVYGTIGRLQAAYFKMINEKGGVNGRKINFISLDDGYSPPKTVEATRRLVEQDQVLLLFNTLGTPPNTAIQKYMNAKKVPQLFVATGATKWNDPKNFPWTMGFQPNYQVEGAIYAKHMIATKPDGKIAILYQNDDYGKDYLKGIRDGLGDRVKQIVAEMTFEVTDPTIDSQIVTLKASGADVYFNIATPKFAAMAIRRAYDIGWKPLQYLNNTASSVAAVLEPAGLEKSVGIISTQAFIDPNDARFQSHPAVLEWRAFMAKYYPEGSLSDLNNIYAYVLSQSMIHVLKNCGDDLTRENVMKQAANLKDYEPAGILPGIKINTSADDFAPIEAEQLVRFDGKQWVPFGEIIGK